MAFPRVRFGTAGNPTTAKSTVEGIAQVRTLGLDAFEIELVHGASKVKVETAQSWGKVAKENDIRLSAHGPYYINLISEKPETRVASVERVLQTARVIHHAGGDRVVFHPGFYGKIPQPQAVKELHEWYAKIIDGVKQEKLKATIAPETTGGWKELGSLDELLGLTEAFGLQYAWPTLDFSHLHCRNGKPELNTAADFQAIFEKVEKRAGKKAVQKFHAHVQCVKWGPGGEINHLPVDAKAPDLKMFMALLAKLCEEQGYGGTVICESPLLEKDTLRLQEWFNTALNGS
ncbi:endonuclease 4 [uncultured archaeon]|nr:endonuclease 4 [uncultured archaeon]